MTDDLASVRLWSRLAAMACAALAAFLISLQTTIVTPEQGMLGAAAISVVIAPREAPPTRLREPAPLIERPSPLAANITAASSETARGLALRLWDYGARGEIVFDNAEQFGRCVAARERRREEPDCPSAYETAELRLGDERPRGLNLEPAAYRRGG